MCQCPERGDTHFYFFKKKILIYTTACVNALKGATLISTRTHNYSTAYAKVCQCPERGDPHFYNFDVMGNLVQAHVCQCPERGDPHFYFLIMGYAMYTKDVSMP